MKHIVEFDRGTAFVAGGLPADVRKGKSRQGDRQQIVRVASHGSVRVAARPD